MLNCQLFCGDSMFDKQQIVNEISKSFVNNIGNKITIELANGMLQEIAKHIPDMRLESVEGEPIVDTTAADTSTKE